MFQRKSFKILSFNLLQWFTRRKPTWNTHTNVTLIHNLTDYSSPHQLINENFHWSIYWLTQLKLAAPISATRHNIETNNLKSIPSTGLVCGLTELRLLGNPWITLAINKQQWEALPNYCSSDTSNRWHFPKLTIKDKTRIQRKFPHQTTTSTPSLALIYHDCCIYILYSPILSPSSKIKQKTGPT